MDSVAGIRVVRRAAKAMNIWALLEQAKEAASPGEIPVVAAEKPGQREIVAFRLDDLHAFMGRLNAHGIPQEQG